MDEEEAPPASIFASGESFDEFMEHFIHAQNQLKGFGPGTECQIADYDSVTQSDGTLAILRAGTNFAIGELVRPPGDDGQAAIGRTSYWNQSGSKYSVQTEIRSPYMKAALKEVVPLYKDRNIRFTHIILYERPEHLFHYRDDLFAYGQRCDPGSVEQMHVSFLLMHIQQELADAISTYTVNVERVEPPSISFEYFWTLFKQDDLVYFSPSVTGNGAELVAQSVSVRLDCSCEDASHRASHEWICEGSCLDTDGQKLQYSSVAARLRRFGGLRRLSELSVLPLRFHPDQDAIKTRLAARGRKFVSLMGCHHLRYKGTAQIFSRGALDVKTIDGPIMIDPEKFYERSGATAPTGTTVSPWSLTEELLLQCRSHIGGYDLTEREWGRFHVDRTGPVLYDTAVFSSSLMLEDKYKNMLLSLVRMQSSQSEHSFDDFVRGKGKGLVFLLHGEPGVGKTLTAESIADCCNRPLLRIEAAALIEDGAYLSESKLESALRLAERWEAMALLDEADMFLETRSQSRLRRNSMVTTFLRILEYYQGVLFLTTNRATCLDPAFKSRIQVAIYYPPLNTDQRRELWRIFLAKVSAPSRPEAELGDMAAALAPEELNGRQIRDVVRIAQASALGEARVVEERHLRDGLDALRTFEDQSDKAVRPHGVVIRVNKRRGKKRRRVSYDYPSDEEDEDSDSTF